MFFIRIENVFLDHIHVTSHDLWHNELIPWTVTYQWLEPARLWRGMGEQGCHCRRFPPPVSSAAWSAPVTGCCQSQVPRRFPLPSRYYGIFGILCVPRLYDCPAVEYNNKLIVLKSEQLGLFFKKKKFIKTGQSKVFVKTDCEWRGLCKRLSDALSYYFGTILSSGVNVRRR